MFNERIALKMRLEQMKEAEEQLLSKLQTEREAIFNRLRELDSTSEQEAATVENIHYIDSHSKLIEVPSNTLENAPKTRKGRPSRRSKTTKMRESAITILKEQDAPIRGSVLQKQIEDRTGFRIANMTTFMNTIKKTDDNIMKLGRGLYYYQKSEHIRNNGTRSLG
ncbi:Rok-like winged helix domain-containing protein [Lederbergia panacisoli]|uniref:Rok-like winged helix domain-containing protein n=1 Tax=Lederbergia panacisoli TaxID=1255251 RepID=UPI00214C9061|nr:competence protein ComK [Lederbergia panacisoli]MCR2820135.1 competence protein ComK [Lederbergia panacisoli]